MTDAHDSLDQSFRRPFAACSFLLLSHSPSIIFISVTLLLSTRHREIQFHRPPLPSPLPSPSPSPSSFAQPISVTMGWFPERSGVDAKLSEGSLFDLLLPIYKHENASGKKRASVRAYMLGRRGAGTCRTMRRGSGIEAEREKEKKSAKRWPPSYLLRGVFICPTLSPPTSIICIRYSGTHHANVFLAATSPIVLLFLPLSVSLRISRSGRPVSRRRKHRPTWKRHARVAAAAVTAR